MEKEKIIEDFKHIKDEIRRFYTIDSKTTKHLSYFIDKKIKKVKENENK